MVANLKEYGITQGRFGDEDRKIYLELQAYMHEHRDVRQLHQNTGMTQDKIAEWILTRLTLQDQSKVVDLDVMVQSVVSPYALVWRTVSRRLVHRTAIHRFMMLNLTQIENVVYDVAKAKGLATGEFP